MRSHTTILERSLAVLGVGAAAILWPGSSGAGDEEPLQGAKPKVALSDLRFQRLPSCTWALTASVHSTDTSRVALLAEGFALPSNPSIVAARSSGMVEPGKTQTLSSPARVFAWPPSVKTVELSLEAGYQTSAMSLIETKMISIQLPPTPVAEIPDPVVTDRTDGTRSVVVKVGVASKDGAVALDRGEVLLRICTSSSGSPTFTCLADKGVSGSLVPASCPGGQKLGSATVVVPKSVQKLRVTALLRGSGKAFGEKTFELP